MAKIQRSEKLKQLLAEWYDLVGHPYFYSDEQHGGLAKYENMADFLREDLRYDPKKSLNENIKTILGQRAYDLRKEIGAEIKCLTT